MSIFEPGDCATSGGNTPSDPGFDVESNVLCDVLPDGTTAGYALAVYEYDAETGAPVGAPTFVDLTTGDPYVAQGTLQPCLPADVPIFAGFVCDIVEAHGIIPRVLPSCPGTPLADTTADIVGAGYTEGPAGVYIQTGNADTSLVLLNNPSDPEHGICRVLFELNAANGNNGFAAYGFQIIDVDGLLFGSDPVFIATIEGLIGVGSDTPMPVGAVASAVLGGTTVTFTNAGPSQNLMTSTNTGNFLTREGDGDGFSSVVLLEFDPPIRTFSLQSNTTFDGASGIVGLQRSDATPGVAAIPAQGASKQQVKQFRNPDGTSFYENLDGTDHAVAGAIGDCGDTFSEVLCDSVGPFVRVYDFLDGAITGFIDYDLAGAGYVAVGTPVVCDSTRGFRHTPVEVLCWTETANPANVVTFLRRYLVQQDGVTVDAALDTLLDGFTPFVAANTGTVGICCCADGGGVVTTPVSVNSQHRLVAAADAAWTPAEVVGTLLSVTFTVLTGTANVLDSNGTAANGLPAGLSSTWSAEDADSLAGPQSIDSVTGSVYVVWTQK